MKRDYKILFNRFFWKSMFYYDFQDELRKYNCAAYIEPRWNGVSEANYTIDYWENPEYRYNECIEGWNKKYFTNYDKREEVKYERYPKGFGTQRFREERLKNK